MSISRATTAEAQRQWPVVTHGYLPLIALTIPALLLSSVAAGSGSLRGDITFTLWLQGHIPQGLGWLFQAVNAIGGTLGAMIVTLSLTALLYRAQQITFAVLLLLTLPVRATNVLLKLVAASPRPPEDLVRVTEYASGHGFPSGHVMGATLLYGMLLIVASRVIRQRKARLAAQVATATMLILTGISRIYVGAHWPSDVLGGYLFGAIGLILILSLAGRVVPAITARRAR